MGKGTIGIVAVGIAAVIGFGAYAGGIFNASAASQKPIEIKWLIAHEPITLFDRASVDFANEFNKDGDGTVHITILGPKDYGSTNGHLSTPVVLNALDSGQVQMATAVVGALSSSTIPELGVINLPYLFKNYPSAEKVFDGAAGQQLLDAVGMHTKEMGLAFTFSGGFMVIESDTKKIETANDLKGLNIGTIDGPTAIATLSSFGAKPSMMDSGKGVAANGLLLDNYDGMETPYTRIFPEIGQKPKYVAETFHGLFTTLIMVNKNFFSSLSPKNQEAFKKAAQVAADDERADSIALGMKHRQELIDGGTIITTLSTSSVDQLKAESQPVYQAYEASFGKDLISEIEAEQK